MDIEVTISRNDFYQFLDGETIRKDVGDDIVFIDLEDMSYGEIFKLVGVVKRNRLPHKNQRVRRW